MKPRTVEDWIVVLDAVEWFQKQLRQMTPEQVRKWISKDAAIDSQLAAEKGA